MDAHRTFAAPPPDPTPRTNPQMDPSRRRPDHIDLHPRPFDPSRTGQPSPRADLPSPRSGDVPPALSPLDAFAFQGRMLARKFEEENNGRRLSRLPHLTVANEFGRPRQPFNAGSAPSASRNDQPDTTPESGTSPEMTLPQFRPQSYYPSIQSFDDARQSVLLPTQNGSSALDTVAEHPERPTNTLRSHSPDPIPEEPVAADPRPANAFTGPSDRHARPFMPQKKLTNESDQSSSSATLAPPKSPAFSRSPRQTPAHLRSPRMDSGDDTDSLSVNGDSGDGRRTDRKLSIGSAQSRPRSPFSPVFAPPRSPSMSSDYSMAGDRLYPRQSQNFSRPMSPRPPPSLDNRDARPSLEQGRGLGLESPGLRPSFDNSSINESIDSPMFPPAPTFDAEGRPILGPNGAPSYIYAKYSLPRGRIVSRESMSAQDFLTHKFEWQQPSFEGNVERLAPQVPEAASARAPVEAPVEASVETSVEKAPKSSAERTARAPRFTEDLAALDWQEPKLPDLENLFGPHSHASILATIPGHAADDGRPKTSAAASSRNIRSHKSNPSFPPANLSSSNLFNQQLHAPSRSKDDFTVVPTLDPSKMRDQLQKSMPTTGDQVTAEDHLSKGIACHENGELQKSTYHLRLAARAGHPTAMLLYALAARHGWGMRPNQAEGVAWLRKAVDSSELEVADDESPFTRAAQESGQAERNAKAAAEGPLEAIARRSHKAQLALSIYELGVSYMNGWGVGQDKSLALKCFEIAGGWGDADALAEAGFCYAKGVGCKKDMPKAAGLYRAAEAKGISMAGNSWIYKDKYMPRTSPDAEERKGRASRKDDDKKDKEKKPRDKSRTRTIFGGRRKEAVKSANERAELD